MTLATRLEDYIETLVITQGRHAGQPFKLLPWQRRFLRGAFKPGVMDAALSLGRGGGKTTFVAAVASATVDVDGPLVQPRASNVVVASSFLQAKIAFDHVLAFLEPTLAKYGRGPKGRYRVNDTVNSAMIKDTVSGASLRCIGSDAQRMMGNAPALVLADELAFWPAGNVESMISALSTSRGKIPDSRVLYLGTRAASGTHPFEKMLLPGGGGADYRQVHAADPDDNPFSVKSWRKANPGLDHLPDLLAAIRKEAGKAAKDGEALASFRSLRLNQGVSDTRESWLLDPDTWSDIEREDTPKVGRYYLGIDLGENASMSCAAAYFVETGALQAIGVFPEQPDLLTRGHADGVGELYVRAEARGELFQAGELVSDPGELLRLALEQWGRPHRIVVDTWRLAKLKEILGNAKFPPTAIEVRRHGFLDGGSDIREFLDAALDGHLHPFPSLILRSAIAEARIIVDAGGNSKLTKSGAGRRRSARDDAIAASIICVAVGRRAANRPAVGPPSVAVAS